jgi:3D (Asp-Asp-Asp) domain-containing protein
MKNTIRFTLLALTVLLASCSDSDKPQQDEPTASVSAIIATVSADFSSGAHAVISEDTDGSRMALNDLVPTASDITVAASGDYFYRIERAFAGNNITRFANSDPQTVIWQYSTNDAGSAVASNPIDMIFVNETKAYVLRYGTSKIWIVNPSATSEAEFKTGEIDLSVYDADGVPEMANGVIVNGKLYVTLQRLESFAVSQTAYVAIIDTATDIEIDANISGDTLKGIPLLTRNPTNIVYEPVSDSIYVQGSGSFFPEEFTGGIEKIDLSSYTTTLIQDDGDASAAPYGLITEMAVVSDKILYFVGYASFADNTLYRMDLTTGDVQATAVASLLNSQIAYITVDDSGLLWVSDSANATVHIIDPVTDAEVDALSTNLNPDKVVFVN